MLSMAVWVAPIVLRPPRVQCGTFSRGCTHTHIKSEKRLSAIVKQHFYPRELNVSDSVFVLSFLIILGGISPWVENMACSASPFVYVLCPCCPFLESDWGRRRGKTQTSPPLFITSCDKTETGWRLSCIHGFETPTSSPFFIVMGPKCCTITLWRSAYFQVPSSVQISSISNKRFRFRKCLSTWSETEAVNRYADVISPRET